MGALLLFPVLMLLAWVVMALVGGILGAAYGLWMRALDVVVRWTGPHVW